MSKKLSIWKVTLDKEKEETQTQENRVDETRAIRLDPIVPTEDQPVNMDGYPFPLPPKTKPGRISRKGSPASRTFSVCIAMSRNEAKFFKRKAKEFNTSFSALIRTALYVYLQMDPEQRIAVKKKK